MEEMSKLRFISLLLLLLLCSLSVSRSDATNNQHTNAFHEENSLSDSRAAERHLMTFDTVCPDGTAPTSYRCGCDVLSASDRASVHRVTLNGAIQCTPICGPDDASGCNEPDPETPQQDCSNYVCVHNNCGATDLGGSDVQVIRGGCEFSDEAGWFVCQGGFTVDRQTFDKVSNGACAPVCGQPQLSCQFPARFGPPVYLPSPSPDEEDEKKKKEKKEIPETESNCEKGAEPDGYICSCSPVSANERGTLQAALYGQDASCVPYCGDPSPLLAGCQKKSCQTDVCIGPRANVMCAAFVPQNLANAINNFDCSSNKGRSTVECRGAGGSYVEVDEPSFRTIRQGVCLSACDVDAAQTRCRFNPVFGRTFLNKTSPSVEPSVPPEDPPESEAAPSSTSEPESPPSSAEEPEALSSSIVEPDAPPSTEPSADAPESEPEVPPSAEPSDDAPESQPDAAPESEPDAAPDSEPDDAPESQPDTAPESEPDEAPESEPDEAPESEPDEAPESEPDEAPESEPDEAPESEPDEAPESEPDYAPESEPDYAPESEPDYAPESEPDYAPESEPDYAPESEPDYAPASEPEADICEAIRRMQVMSLVEADGGGFEDDEYADMFDIMFDLPDECVEPAASPSEEASEIEPEPEPEIEPEAEPSAPASETDVVDDIESEIEPITDDGPAETPGAEESEPAPAPAPGETVIITLDRSLENNVYAGPWSECSQLCKQAATGGQATRERTVICRNPFGVPLPEDQCDPEDFKVLDTREECDLENCAGEAYYVLGPWGKCSKDCAEFNSRKGEYVPGKQTRDVSCFGDDGELTRAACVDILPKKTKLERSCNSNPCDVVFYDTSKWSECSCEDRRQTRKVSCVDVEEKEVDLKRCEALGSKEPSKSRRCNPTGCDTSSRKLLQQPRSDSCKGVSCSSYGNCSDGNCKCDDGFEGVDCQLDERGKESSCPSPGVLGPDGECCPSGVFDLVEYKCCGGGNKDVQLDAEGKCCDGTLDNCGVCNGSSVLDAIGRCCSGTLDGTGLCCFSNEVDECGVCDGDSSSCYTEVKVTFPLRRKQFEKRCQEPFADFLRTSFNLDDSVEVTLNATNPEGRSSTEATFLVAGVPNDSDSLDRILGRRGFEFLDSERQCQFSKLQTSKQPRCGNGVCEIGEAPSNAGSSGKFVCPEDCSIAFSWCELSPGFRDQRVACSGRGRCLYGNEGLCDCFEGYMGVNCELCAADFYRLDDDDTRCFPRQGYSERAKGMLPPPVEPPTEETDGSVVPPEEAPPVPEEPEESETSVDPQSATGTGIPRQDRSLVINQENLESDDAKPLAYILPVVLVPLLLVLLVLYYFASKRSRDAKNKTTEELLAEKRMEQPPLPPGGLAKTESSIWKDFRSKLATHVGLRAPHHRISEPGSHSYHDSPTSSKEQSREDQPYGTNRAEARTIPRELRPESFDSPKSSIATPSAYNRGSEHPRGITDTGIWDSGNRTIKRAPDDESSLISLGESDSDHGHFGAPSGETSNRAVFQSTGEMQNMSTIDESHDDRETITGSTMAHGFSSERQSVTPRTAGSATTDSD